jgi:hypothetical protein
MTELGASGTDLWGVALGGCLGVWGWVRVFLGLPEEMLARGLAIGNCKQNQEGQALFGAS